MKCIASAVIFSVAFAGNALAFSLQLGSVTPEAYASGIMYSLDAMPIHDGASYALYDVDKSIFQLKDSDQFGNIKNKVSDE